MQLRHVCHVVQGKYAGRRMRAVASPLKNFELADESQQVPRVPTRARSLTQFIRNTIRSDAAGVLLRAGDVCDGLQSSLSWRTTRGTRRSWSGRQHCVTGAATIHRTALPRFPC